MTKRIEFRLSMPGRASWNGGWSGSERNYTIVRTLTDKAAEGLMGGKDRQSWTHAWDDGWTALVTARVMDRGERARKSDGFRGYDWMVRNIIAYGSPYTTGTAEGQAPS